MSWWETRGDDSTPSGWTGHIGTSMFSKVALMLSSLLNKLLFGGGGEFLFVVYASAPPSRPQISVSNSIAPSFVVLVRKCPAHVQTSQICRENASFS